MHSIFINPERRAEWRQQIAGGEPTALAILTALRKAAADPLTATDPSKAEDRGRLFESALARLCLAWIEDNRSLAESGRLLIDSLLESYEGSDLGKGGNALAAVLAWDYGAALWEPVARRDFADRIAAIARSFTEIGRGNPHSVTNNWWMITHGGCLLSCLAVDQEEGAAGPIDLADLKAWSLERFRAFCSLFGNAGLYHEGSGYIAYTLSMLMPTLVAVERHLEPDILQTYPQLRNSLASMLIGTATFTHLDSGAEAPRFGASLQWNDAGRGSIPLNPFMPGMAVAPPEWRGALRSWFDRLAGIQGADSWECPYRGLPLTVALYPFSSPREDPEKVLPKWVLDQRQGLGMWRSAWGDGQESVFGWYARSTHAGGHSQDDAASIRLMALGRTWICGGGQARAKAEWQSVFTHAAMEARPRPAPLAHLFCTHLAPAGGVVGIDTRQSLVAYSERYLAWRTDLGHPFCLAVLDLLDDHVEPPRDWQWTLSFPADLEARIHEDQAGFSLLDPARGTLTGRFLIDRPASLEVAGMPASQRTYSNGRRVDYPGDLYVRARYNSWKKARILVVLVIDPPGCPEPAPGWDAHRIRLNSTEWTHPFSPAILKSVDLAHSSPNRMTHPAG